MGNEAWVHADDQLWDDFERKLAFKLDWQHSTDPAINEPAGSVTLDLSPVFQSRDSDEFLRRADHISELVFESFKRVFDDQTRLLVLDWLDLPVKRRSAANGVDHQR